MITPGGNLEQLIHYTALDRVLQLNICEGYVPTCNCPLCSSSGMGIFRDIETGGWHWYCKACGWAGPSLLLYQIVKNFPNYRLAWQSLSAEAEIDIPSAFLETMLRDYEFFVNKRISNQSIWARANKRVEKELPTIGIERLEAEGLWGGWVGADFSRNIGRFMSCLTYPQFLMISKYFDIGSPVVRSRKKDSLFMPFEVAPGLVSAYLIWGQYPHSEFKGVISGVKEGGLLGLSSLDLSAETVIILTDPKLFLMKQKSWLNHHSEPNNILCCATPSARWAEGYSTNQAFLAVPNSRVVFWSGYPSIDTINFARRFGNRGHVSTYFCKEVLMERADNAFANVYNTIKPWQIALKQWLLSSGCSDRRKIVSSLSPALSVDEVGLLRDSCLQDEWTDLSTAFSDSKMIKSFRIGKFTFIEREGRGWYHIKAKPKIHEDAEELISDATITLQEATVIDGEAYLSGVIRHKGEQFAFTEKDSVIRKGGASWLTAQCVEHTVYPNINPRFRNRLLDLAVACNKPETRKTVKRVGWDSTEHRWSFPNFAMREGEIELYTGTMSRIKKLPCSEVKQSTDYPGLVAISQWFAPNKLNRTMIQLFAATVANLLLAKSKKPKSGILLLDNIGGDGSQCIEIFGAAMGLQAFSAMSEEVDKVIQTERAHDVPVVLRNGAWKNKSWLNWMQYTNPRNVILGTDDTLAAINMCLTGKWTIIKVPDKCEESHNLFVFESLGNLLMPFLSHCHKVDLESRLGDFPVKAVIEELVQYAAVSWDSVNPPDYFYQGLSKSPDDSWSKVLWAIAYCAYFKLATLNDPTKCNLVAGTGLQIKWSGLVELFKQLGILVPDTESLEYIAEHTEHIKTVFDGWIVSEKLLQSATTEFAQEFLCRPQ